jgi:putative RecB family exonuclease
VPDPAAATVAALGPDEPLALSHSGIAAYLECPLQYYFSHVAHVPLPANPTLMYGQAIHHGIKVWHQHRLKGLPIETRDVIAAYESAWSSEGFLTLAHEERMQAQGREVLERFVRNDLAAGGTPIAVEMEFRFHLVHNQVSGRWDRIDERPEGIVLVDYKTSETDEEERAEQKAKESARTGQLGLYALAYHETREVMPARLELHFVGSGTVGALDVVPEHLDRARERIERAAEGIRAARFEATPDARTCGRCDYRQICRFSAARRT